MTAQVRTHGGILIPFKLNFSAHAGVSVTTTAIKIVMMATPTIILVTGLIDESYKDNINGSFLVFITC